MASPARQRSARQSGRTLTRQMARLPRTAGPSADPGQAEGPGQRPNVPTGTVRD